jgi:hypothetical protein
MRASINTLDSANIALRQSWGDLDCPNALDSGPPGRRPSAPQEVKLARHLKGPWQTNIFSPVFKRLLRALNHVRHRSYATITGPVFNGGLAGPDFPPRFFPNEHRHFSRRFAPRNNQNQNNTRQK